MTQLPLPRIAALGALLFAFVIHAAVAEERFSRQVNFNIAAQTVESALIEFSKQADVQVMVGTLSLNGQKTEGVKGKLSVTEALEQLLKNTGLEYQAKGNTVTVRSVKNARADAVVLPLVEGVRLASNGAAGDAAQGAAPSINASDQPTLETVLVTGTNIRGAASPTPVLSFSALDIERTGYATAQDWIETLPQNFGNLPNEEIGGVGNFNRGTGVNLRGLGAGATLVLINGRRQPSSGLEGDFVDISSIPASAIERVEVLTDGASAIYGSDAIGGVVNFVLRKNFDGAETKVRYATTGEGADEIVASQLLGMAWTTGHVLLDYQYYDRTSLQTRSRSYAANADQRSRGGDDFRVTTSNPGNIFGLDGTPYAIPPGQDGTSLTADQLLAGALNRENQLEGTDLLPERRMNSAFLSVEQQLGDNWELFVDARYSRRNMTAVMQAPANFLLVPASNPFYVNPTPFFPFVTVAYSFFDDFGPSTSHGETDTYLTAAGARLAFGADWQAKLTAATGAEKLKYELPIVDQDALDAALADSDPATAFNPFGDGSHTNPDTIAGIRGLQLERGKSQISVGNLIIDGPAFSLPGGAAKVAFGADYRVDELERGVVSPLKLDRDIAAGFFELSMPLVSGMNARPGIRQLDLVAAGRYEDYSDFGDTFNPKFGVRYAPSEFLELHASWGTSFKAPRIFDLETKARPANFVFALPLADPQSPFGFSDTLIRFGGNADLQEETATSWTAGLTFTLSEKLSASVSYYDIVYEDRIATPGPSDPTAILLEEQTWASVIERNPPPSVVAGLCNDPNFIGDRDACLLSTPVVVDLRKHNIAKTTVRGIDLTMNHELQSSVGVFGLALNGTYVFDYEVGVSDASPLLNLVDTIDNPVALRLRAVGSWTRGGFDISLGLNHTGSYKDGTQAGAHSVDSWDTVDVRMGYHIAEDSGWYSGLDLALSVTNALDSDPPFVNRAFGYDISNATPMGQFVSLQVSKSWNSKHQRR